jgi:hypothetical protein
VNTWVWNVFDIAKRAAELAAEASNLNDRPGGGAVVRVWFG